VHAAASTAIPEVLCRTVTPDEALGEEALDEILDLLDDDVVLAVGPGLGRGEVQSRLIERILREVSAPLVFDADALNALEGGLDRVAAATSRTIVLTPHPAELGRLLGSPTASVVADRLGAARQASEVGRCVVLAKGYRTVVVAGSRVRIVDAGGPELATAGTGDVLTGAIAARLAAGLDPLDAAVVAASVHGEAGDIAGARGGAEGVLASEVADALPLAVERLRSGLPSIP
jgi:NAD(P)H-hydrate epimerase